MIGYVLPLLATKFYLYVNLAILSIKGCYPNYLHKCNGKKDAEESERVAEWLRRLTHKPKVRTAVGSNPALASWSLSVTLARVDQSHVREIW